MKKYLEVAKVYLKVKLMWRAGSDISALFSIVMKNHICFAALGCDIQGQGNSSGIYAEQYDGLLSAQCFFYTD